MFRALVFTAALLAGCGSNTTTEPRIVEMPDLPQNYTSSLKENCVWKQFEASVFNQRDQRLMFRYQDCAPSSKVHLEIQRGNAVQYGLDLEGIDNPIFDFPILHIYKQGPSTPVDFIKSQLSKAVLKSGQCSVIEVEKNIWTIDSLFEVELPDFETLDVWTRPDDPCGEYVSHLKHGDQGEVYVFNEGIVFKIAGPGVGDVIDLSSVTYENRG